MTRSHDTTSTLCSGRCPSACQLGVLLSLADRRYVLNGWGSPIGSVPMARLSDRPQRLPAVGPSGPQLSMASVLDAFAAGRRVALVESVQFRGPADLVKRQQCDVP